MLRSEEFSTPWLRDQLIDRLLRLSDNAWLTESLQPTGVPKEALEGLLDFFDDTGVLDEPEAHVGAYLRAEEVPAVRVLANAVDLAVDRRDRTTWESASRAARDLVGRLSSRP